MSNNQATIKNAIIKSATITCADYGILSAWLHLEYDCCGPDFGGYCLYVPKTFTHHNIKSAAGHFIYRCMEIAGVMEWSHMAGKTIRVESDSSKIYAIGHIIKNDWFDPSIDFAGDASGE